MTRACRPSLQHPLADPFDRAVASLGAALTPETIRRYRQTARSSLTYLGGTFRTQTPALATNSHINLLLALRWTFHELAWMNGLPELAHLIQREDIPRLPYNISPRSHPRLQDRPPQTQCFRREQTFPLAHFQPSLLASQPTFRKQEPTLGYPRLLVGTVPGAIRNSPFEQ